MPTLNLSSTLFTRTHKQQLVYLGKVLKDDESLATVFSSHPEDLESIIVHMIDASKVDHTPPPSSTPAAATPRPIPAPTTPRPAGPPPATAPFPTTAAAAVTAAGGGASPAFFFESLEQSLGPALRTDPRAQAFYQQAIGTIAYSTAISAILADAYPQLSQCPMSLPLLAAGREGVTRDLFDTWTPRGYAPRGPAADPRAAADLNAAAEDRPGAAGAAANHAGVAQGQGRLPGNVRVRVFRIRLNVAVLWRCCLAALLLWGQMENPQRALMVLAAIVVFQVLNMRWMAPLRDRALRAMGGTGHWMRDLRAGVVAFLASLIPGWPLDLEERAAMNAARAMEDALIRQIENELEEQEERGAAQGPGGAAAAPGDPEVDVGVDPVPERREPAYGDPPAQEGDVEEVAWGGPQGLHED